METKAEGIIYSRLNGGFQFLLLKRTPRDGGFWQPLTETLREGETIRECLLRGVREELGVMKVIAVTDEVFRFTWKKNGLLCQEFVYGVEISGKEKIVLNDQEHSKYRWCGFDEAVSLLEKENNRKALIRFLDDFIEND